MCALEWVVRSITAIRWPLIDRNRRTHWLSIGFWRRYQWLENKPNIDLQSIANLSINWFVECFDWIIESTYHWFVSLNWFVRFGDTVYWIRNPLRYWVPESVADRQLSWHPHRICQRFQPSVNRKTMTRLVLIVHLSQFNSDQGRPRGGVLLEPSVEKFHQNAIPMLEKSEPHHRQF